MPRFLAAALAALLAVPGAARAEGEAKASPPAFDATAPVAPAEVDPKVQAAIQRAVERAKEEVRNEMRAELQGAQSAAEFMGAVAEGPRRELLELDGYYRMRGQVLDRLNLRSATDSAGYNYFPKPLHGGAALSEANMRLRLEPTLNVSETVRIRTQVDILDNYVLGSSTNNLSYPVPFYGSSNSLTACSTTTVSTSTGTTTCDPSKDRDSIIPKRVWGEVQTPVGLLSFGRMPSAWGLGIMANAGRDLDADYGDTVDRLQFALPPVTTPLGDLVFVPILDYDGSGVLQVDPHYGAGTGQVLDADNTDDATTYGLKIVRIDTDDEIRRKLERGQRSVNYGLYYNYRTQKYVYPAWIDDGLSGTYTSDTDSTTYNKRGVSAHFGSLWARWMEDKWRVEGELVGVYGSAGNANATTVGATTISKIYMHQWGLALQAEYKKSSRTSFGLDLGAASGDSAPGFGNIPGRSTLSGTTLPNYGAIEGPQWGRPGDNTINNYRFNPAYVVDLILYRRILGQVTDSWYLRPSVRWDIIPGLTLDGAAIYSQAMFSESTPSSSSVNPSAANSPLASKGHRPLGLEFDGKLSLAPGNGFRTWGEMGVLKPLAGMGTGTSLAWVFNFGFAATF